MVEFSLDLEDEFRRLLPLVRAAEEIEPDPIAMPGDGEASAEAMPPADDSSKDPGHLGG